MMHETEIEIRTNLAAAILEDNQSAVTYWTKRLEAVSTAYASAEIHDACAVCGDDVDNINDEGLCSDCEVAS